jgi:hypothetical protein
MSPSYHYLQQIRLGGSHINFQEPNLRYYDPLKILHILMVNPVYDGWFSVGSVREHQVSLDGKQISIQVISYSKYLRDKGCENIRSVPLGLVHTRQVNINNMKYLTCVQAALYFVEIHISILLASCAHYSVNIT